MTETNSKTDKALAARTLYWAVLGNHVDLGTAEPSTATLEAWEAVVGLLTDPDSYDATETVTITPAGIWVGDVEVPGMIDADSVYAKPYPEGTDIVGVTLTIMAGAVELNGGVTRSPFVGRPRGGNKILLPDPKTD